MAAASISSSGELFEELLHQEDGEDVEHERDGSNLRSCSTSPICLRIRKWGIADHSGHHQQDDDQPERVSCRGRTSWPMVAGPETPGRPGPGCRDRVTTVELSIHLGIRTLSIVEPRTPSGDPPPVLGGGQESDRVHLDMGQRLERDVRARARTKGKMKTRAKKMRTA